MQNAIKILLGGCIGGYAISFVCLVLRKRRAGLSLFVVSWLGTVLVFALNWVVCQEPPFGNMYHVLIFLSMSFLPINHYLAFREKGFGLTHYFVLAAAIPLVGAQFMSRDIVWRRMPALQSAWFVPHVFSYMVSYALAFLAFIVTTAAILKRYLLKCEWDSAAKAKSFQMLKLAFPFMTFGLLSGAMWAEKAWGRYWSWDPKETWALITWLLYVIYFHCRKHAQLKQYELLAQILAFLALLATFILVNVIPKLGSALHSYGT